MNAKARKAELRKIKAEMKWAHEIKVTCNGGKTRPHKERHLFSIIIDKMGSEVIIFGDTHGCIDLAGTTDNSLRYATRMRCTCGIEERYNDHKLDNLINAMAWLQFPVLPLAQFQDVEMFVTWKIDDLERPDEPIDEQPLKAEKMDKWRTYARKNGIDTRGLNKQRIMQTAQYMGLVGNRSTGKPFVW